MNRFDDMAHTIIQNTLNVPGANQFLYEQVNTVFRPYMRGMNFVRGSLRIDGRYMIRMKTWKERYKKNNK